MTGKNTSQEGSLHQLDSSVVETLMSDQLTKADYRLFWYLFKFGKGSSNLPSQSEIALHLGIRRETVNQSFTILRSLNLLPDWMPVPSIHQNIEYQICDRLQSQLGGLREVKTPAGRIDLLTDTEIIEVKNVRDWKAAMGQILAYSGFYPEHGKRLHLFSKKGEKLSSASLAICAELGITVTFEEVE